MIDQAINFLKESKNEIGKVVFPGRQEVIGATAVVIVSVVLVSLFLGLVDLEISWLMAWWFGRESISLLQGGALLVTIGAVAYLFVQSKRES